MKNVFLLFLPLLFSLLLSCEGDESQQTAGTAEPTEIAEADASEAMAEASDPADEAICLWSKVGLRDAPGSGKEVKYLTTIYFGEKVNRSGKEEEIGDKTYWEVQLSDGTKGWVRSYLFAEGGNMAVASSNLPLHRRPDLATMTGKSFESGDILVIENSKDDWHEVVGFEREKGGWIKGTANLSQKQEDLLTVMLYERALQEESAEKRREQLEMILGNASLSGSAFLPQVRSALEGTAGYTEPEEIEIPDLAQNQLSIIATKLNVRSGPSVEADNVVFQLERGDIAKVLQKAANRETVNDMEDYWYQIEYQGQKGWVFGYHTSRRIGL